MPLFYFRGITNLPLGAKDSIKKRSNLKELNGFLWAGQRGKKKRKLPFTYKYYVYIGNIYSVIYT